MSENPILRSHINDYIFCPVSIYFHGLYSMDNNKVYNIPLPENDPEMHEKFKNTLKAMEEFDMNTFHQDNADKCILNNIITDINNKFKKSFDQSDSVYIFQMSASCKVTKFGYAENEDDSLIII